MLTPNEVAERTFHTSRFGGYNTEEVDDFMDVLTEDYNTLYKENAILKSKLKALVDKVGEYRSTEDDMRRTLMTARKKAEDMVDDAERERAARLAGVDAEVAEYRAQLERDIAAAESQRESARAATEEFLSKMRDMVRAHAAFLENVPNMEAVEIERDEVAETAAAIDSSLTAIYGADELTAAQESAPESADEPTRIIDLGGSKADQDYNM